MAKPRNRRPVSVAITPSGGQWVAFVTVATGDRRKRSTAMCAACLTDPRPGCDCYRRCEEKVRKLEDEVSANAVARAGRPPTVEGWVTTWLTDIAPSQPSGSRTEPLRPLTLEGYWSLARTWVFPHLGRVRLDELDTDHLDALYSVMYTDGRASSYVRKVHSMLRRALGLAVRRGKAVRNVAELMDWPGTPSRRRHKALTVDQARAVLTAIDGEPDALRWKVGLAIGPRQGEALGIRWAHVDLEEGTVDTSWQIQRRPWKHGCADPRGCGTHVQARLCPGGKIHDRYHRHGCPKVRSKACAPKCARHAARCPQRHGGGVVFCRPKTYRDEGDVHLVALPASLVRELREHRTAQARLRLAARRWEDHDLVFCQPSGKPIEPRKDYARWQKILAKAGLEGGGTHVLRHTAATMLLELGEKIEVVQEVLGQSDIRTTRGYARVSVGLTRKAADAMDAGLFGAVTDLRSRRRSATDLATADGSSPSPT